MIIGAPKLIVVDGIDGCGKTVACEHISKKTGAVYMKTVGQGPVGKAIREQLLTKVNTHNFLTELTWLLSANLETVYDYAIPTLIDKSVVLDRFISSAYAYQIHRTMNKDCADMFRLVLRKILDDVVPSLYIWINVDAEISLERTVKRGNLDHFDLESVDSRRRTIEGFNELYMNMTFPNQVSIDGNKSQADVLKDIDSALYDFGIIGE